MWAGSCLLIEANSYINCIIADLSELSTCQNVTVAPLASSSLHWLSGRANAFQTFQRVRRLTQCGANLTALLDDFRDGALTHTYIHYCSKTIVHN